MLIPRFVFLLTCVCLLVTGLFVYRGTQEAIEYDGYWHVWIAAQPSWKLFADEYAGTAHPPLYFVLLRLVMNVARSPLALRAIGIISGIIATIAIARIGRWCTNFDDAGLLAAVLFGMSVSMAALANEVRSYMLALCFIVLAFEHYARFWADHGNPRRHTLLWALYSSLAILSHYYSAFFLLACVTAPVYLAAVNRTLRKALRTQLRAHIVPIVSSGAIVGMLAVYLYYEQAQRWAVALNHLPNFYYQASAETVPAFFWRTTRALLGAFLPVPMTHDGIFMGTLLILAAILVFAVYQFHFRERTTVVEALPVAFFTIIIGAIAAAAVLDKYPYGGHMRHQSIIYPFAVLTLVVVINRLAQHHRRFLKRIVPVAGALCFVSHALTTYPPIDAQTQYSDAFHTYFPTNDGVLTDRFSFIVYFMGAHDRDWQFVNDTLSTAAYRIDGRELVLRNFRWGFDLREPALYVDVHQLIRRHALPSLTMFFTPQGPLPIADVASEIRRNAAAAGLDVTKIHLHGRLAFARFAPVTR